MEKRVKAFLDKAADGFYFVNSRGKTQLVIARREGRTFVCSPHEVWRLLEQKKSTGLTLRELTTAFFTDSASVMSRSFPEMDVTLAKYVRMPLPTFYASHQELDRWLATAPAGYYYCASGTPSEWVAYVDKTRMIYSCAAHQPWDQVTGKRAISEQGFKDLRHAGYFVTSAVLQSQIDNPQLRENVVKRGPWESPKPHLKTMGEKFAQADKGYYAVHAMNKPHSGLHVADVGGVRRVYQCNIYQGWTDVTHVPTQNILPSTHSCSACYSEVTALMFPSAGAEEALLKKRMQQRLPYERYDHTQPNESAKPKTHTKKRSVFLVFVNGQYLWTETSMDRIFDNANTIFDGVKDPALGERLKIEVEHLELEFDD